MPNKSSLRKARGGGPLGAAEWWRGSAPLYSHPSTIAARWFPSPKPRFREAWI